MLKAVVVALALWGSTARAGVDDEFPIKALGLQWSASLQQVQAAFPGGTVIPAREHDEISYMAPGDHRVLGLDLPVTLLHFVFTKQGLLDRVFWHFNYADRDDALFGIAQTLGQDYSTKDETTGRLYSWKPGLRARAHFRIGTDAQSPWAFLGVQAVTCGCGSGKH